MELENSTAGVEHSIPSDEYLALRDRAGVVDLDDCGIVRILGQDRVAWAHKLTTANIKGLDEGRGACGLMLNATGHVFADFVVLAQRDALVFYTGGRAKDRLLRDLKRAVFREKVQLEDVSAAWRLSSIQGPQALSVLARALGSIPAIEPFGFVTLTQALVVRNARLSSDGYDLLCRPEASDSTRRALIENGARAVGPDALNAARIEAGIAWYGVDYDETMLAPEARLESCIAENKGCYTGQEVIARIKNRGHVNRLLVQMQAEGDVIPARGDLVFVDHREVGWITSATWSPVRSAPVALGYLRRELVGGDAALSIAHAEVEIKAVVIQ